MWLAGRAAQDGWRPAALVGVGLLLGATLYGFSFGFATTYRRLITYGDTRGLRAQLPMPALATLLFAPLLAAGEFRGQPVGGAVAPLGLQVTSGAFFSGVASTSLHGWLWFAAALAGSWIGVHLRPRFGLAN